MKSVLYLVKTCLSSKTFIGMIGSDKEGVT